MYRILTADPPWKFGDKLPGKGRGAEKHYKTLTVEEICLFPLPEMLDDSVLFLWRVASMQEEALRVIRSWGFTLKTEIVWRKKTKEGKRHFGMGRTVRAEHETCLIATMGKPLVKARNVRSVFDAEEPNWEDVGGMFEAEASRRHSQKPDEFFEIVESLFDGPYVELFARRTRLGWTTLGDQVVAEESGCASTGA